MRSGAVALGRDRIQTLVLAAVAYLPLLANDMGRVAADTKAYLYLDPGRLLARAPYMWQPEVAMGTVTHQNIGYLWPVGPFFWLGEAIGLPDWITQRLWLGSVLLAAGLGMRWFLRTLGWRGAALLVSALAYMLSPYLLNYVDRHSVILLPWAGLPWLMGLTVRALRTPGWRHAAIFGLVTLTVGGVNASSLLLVGIGPVAWLAWCAVEGSAPWRRVVGTAARIGLAFAATGIWWMVGLAIQSRYGLPT
ncbi:MAG: alpha-(1-_3)-arabinofuranosyltransferase family protein, partial [Acidimicrobiales bacterium]